MCTRVFPVHQSPSCHFSSSPGYRTSISSLSVTLIIFPLKLELPVIRSVTLWKHGYNTGLAFWRRDSPVRGYRSSGLKKMKPFNQRIDDLNYNQQNDYGFQGGSTCMLENFHENL
jgi:hypothetical protein